MGLNAPSQRRRTTSSQEQGGAGRGCGSQATSKGQHTVVVRQTKPATHSKAIIIRRTAEKPDGARKGFPELLDIILET